MLGASLLVSPNLYGDCGFHVIRFFVFKKNPMERWRRTPYDLLAPRVIIGLVFFPGIWIVKAILVPFSIRKARNVIFPTLIDAWILGFLVVDWSINLEVKSDFSLFTSLYNLEGGLVCWLAKVITILSKCWDLSMIFRFKSCAFTKWAWNCSSEIALLEVMHTWRSCSQNGSISIGKLQSFHSSNDLEGLILHSSIKFLIHS